MKHLLTTTDKEITGSLKLSAQEPRIAVNAVLFDSDNNIAISYMGSWNLHTLVGGGVDEGEELLAAVEREVWEEAGCKCEITGEIGQIYENSGERDHTQRRYYYFAKVVGEKGKLHLTDEEIEADVTVCWLTPEKALQIITDNKTATLQQEYIRRRDIAVLQEVINTTLHQTKL